MALNLKKANNPTLPSFLSNRIPKIQGISLSYIIAVSKTALLGLGLKFNP